MRRCSFLNDQPSSINVAASQSSNSGCVGSLPVPPKLFGLPAIAWPKCHCQTRFTITRAVSGFSLLVIHCANSVRRPLFSEVTEALFSEPENRLNTPGLTSACGVSIEPPLRMWIRSFASLATENASGVLRLS